MARRGSQRELWVRPVVRAREPVSPRREALPARVAGVLAVLLLLYVIVLMLLHFRIAGG